MKHAITGSINSGKSYFANEIKKRMNFQIIEVDDIRRHILWNSIDSEHVFLRKNLADLFSLPVIGMHALMNREIFTHKIFESPENLYNYSQVATPVIKNYINKIQKNDSFLVWVYILEEGYDDLCNGKVVEVCSELTNYTSTKLIEYRSNIQSSSLFIRKRQADIKYNKTIDIDMFIRNYL